MKYKKIKDKDFHVRGIKGEKLIPTIQGLDVEFDIDMQNLGDIDNLPNSDKIMICQQRGIKQERCNLEK